MQPPYDLDLTHWTGHLLSIFALAGSLMGVFPIVAALAAFIWYMIQIYESPTVKGALVRWRARRTAGRIAKLKRREEQLRRELKRLGGQD